LPPSKCTFRQCIDFVDIAGCSSATDQNTVGENGDFKTLYVKMACTSKGHSYN